MAKKVALGLSGGVDSAVAGYLLKKQGYAVDAIHIICWQQPGCRAEQDRKDAIKTALHLGFKIKVLDFVEAYRNKVLSYFYDEYRHGRTPNPDILCNQEIKFGLFYDWAIKQGYDYIATGHYAKISGDKSDKSQLFSPLDKQKDQTYFLYKIKFQQLSHILFPLGDYLKTQVRDLAKKIKVPVADKPDSMGICFLGDIDVRQLLIKKYGKKEGNVLLDDQTVIGKHQGAWLFTVGQRGGWQKINKISQKNIDNAQMPKLYVRKIDISKNNLYVGEKDSIMQNVFMVSDLHWLDQDWQLVKNIGVKIRNTGKIFPIKEISAFKNDLKVVTKNQIFAISPGQHAVFYDLDTKFPRVLGGGVIENSE